MPANGHNSTLSPAETKALFFRNKASYEKALAVKKAADAAIKNVCKKIKSDHGDWGLDSIKIAIKIQTPEGAAEIEARREAERQAAEWMGLPLGAQGNLFATDRRTKPEIAYQEGFELGCDDRNMEAFKIPERYAPSSPEGQNYAKGYHDGQDKIFNIKQREEGSFLIKGPSLGDAAANDEEGESDDDLPAAAE